MTAENKGERGSAAVNGRRESGGLLLGKDAGEAVQVDIERQGNANILVGGASGKGKTQFVEACAALAADQGKNIEWPDVAAEAAGRFAKETGARVIDNLSEHLEPTEIPVDGYTREKLSVRAWALQLLLYFKLAFQLGVMQLALLERALVELLETHSIFAELPDVLRDMKVPNHMQRSYTHLMQQIRPLFDSFRLPRNGAPRIVRPGQGSITIMRVPAESPGSRIFISLFVLRARLDRLRIGSERDQMWAQGKSSPIGWVQIFSDLHEWSPRSLAVLEGAFRTARKYGLCIWVDLQVLSDVPEAILINAENKFFMGMGHRGAKVAVEQLAVSAEERTDLRNELLSMGTAEAILKNSTTQPYRRLRLVQFHEWAQKEGKEILERVRARQEEPMPVAAPAETGGGLRRGIEDSQILKEVAEVPDDEEKVKPEVGEVKEGGPASDARQEGASGKPGRTKRRAKSEPDPSCRLVGRAFLAPSMTVDQVQDLLHNKYDRPAGVRAELCYGPLIVAQTGGQGLFGTPVVLYDACRRVILTTIEGLNVQAELAPEVFMLSGAALELLAKARGEDNAGYPFGGNGSTSAAAELERARLVVRLPQDRLKLLRRLPKPKVAKLPAPSPVPPSDYRQLVSDEKLEREAVNLMRVLTVFYGIQVLNLSLLMVPVYRIGSEIVAAVGRKIMWMETPPASGPDEVIAEGS